MPTTIFSVPSNTYAPQQITVNPTLPSGKTAIRVVLTTAGWPTGKCVDASIKYPDGSVAGGSSIDGGTPNRQGVFESSFGFKGTNGAALPSGQYAVVVDVVQTVTTTVRVESTP